MTSRQSIKSHPTITFPPPPVNNSIITAKEASKRLQALELEIIGMNGFINRLKSYLTDIPHYININSLFSDYNERYSTQFRDSEKANTDLHKNLGDTVYSKFLELQKKYLTIIDSSPEYKKMHKIDIYMENNNLKNLQGISSYNRRDELYNFGEQRYITLFRYLIFMVDSVLYYIEAISRCPKDKDAQMAAYASQMKEYYTKEKLAKLQNVELFKPLIELLSTKLKAKEPRQQSKPKTTAAPGKVKKAGFFKMPAFFRTRKRETK